MGNYHKNDDWSRTIFIVETCYQLFRSTIRRWSLNPSAEVKLIPKNRQKIVVWAGISVKGLIGYHLFKINMDFPSSFEFFMIILFLMQKHYLVDVGDYRWTTIRNTKVE